jgi:hypothetical protein
MANIITVAELRSVLGVSSSLYSDAYLENIIDSAELTILPMLVSNTTAVVAYKLESNVAYFYTQSEHHFVAGQSVIVAGLPAPFSATVTVVSAGDYYFTAAITNANVTLRDIVPSGSATLSGYSAVDLYSNNASVETAILVVSVEIFQSVTAAGGQIEGVDFAPTPYRMGRSLQNRVIGILTPFIDVSSLVS